MTGKVGNAVTHLLVICVFTCSWAFQGVESRSRYLKTSHTAQYQSTYVLYRVA